MMKRIIFITMLIFELSALSFQLSYAQPPECPLIDASELMEKIKLGEQLVIVDVRSPESYNKGHIPGAISIPAREAVERMPLMMDKEKDRVVIVDIDGRSGWRMCRNMKVHGQWLYVHSLKGGMNSWDGPIEK